MPQSPEKGAFPSPEALESLGLRERLNLIIFGHDTPAGKGFDVVLLWVVLLSVMAVLLESVDSVRAVAGGVLRASE